MNRSDDIWVFDVCGTLFNSNTTFDFLDYLFQKSDEKLQRKLKAIRKKDFTYFYRAVLFRYFNVDLFKKQAVRLLRNFDKQQVELEAVNFLNEILVKKRIEESNQLLERSIHSDATVLLASNSLAPIVKAIANQVGVDYYATSLVEENGKYTGEISRDLTGKKHQVLAEDQLKGYHVVTDNKSDYLLLKQAKKKYVVITNESDRKFWDKLSPEYINA